MKKIFLPVVLMCLLLSGCSNYSEIEDSLLVSGIAIDKGEKQKYMLTAEIVGMSEGSEESSTQSKLLKAEGETLFSALRELNASSSKKLFLSQTTTIVISEDIAKEGLTKVIDMVMRDVELRITNDMIVAKGCRAADIFTLEGIGGPIKSYEINQLLQSSGENLSITPEVKVYDLIDTIGSDGVSSILPAFSYDKSKEENSISLFGTAVFRKGKLVGFLEENESKIMTMLINQTRQGVISEKIKTGTEVYISPKIYSCKTKTKPEYENDKVKMKIDVSMDVGINELTTKEKVLSRENRDKIIDELEKKTEKNMENLIKKLQNDMNADVLGFGEIIYRDNPEKWKKLKETDYFPKIECKIDVKINLRSTGFIDKSPTEKDLRFENK